MPSWGLGSYRRESCCGRSGGTIKVQSHFCLCHPGVWITTGMRAIVEGVGGRSGCNPISACALLGCGDRRCDLGAITIRWWCVVWHRYEVQGDLLLPSHTSLPSLTLLPGPAAAFAAGRPPSDNMFGRWRLQVSTALAYRCTCAGEGRGGEVR